MESRKMTQMNLFAGQEERGRQREQAVDTEREGKGQANGESSADIYPPPCVKQTASGKLLHSTGYSSRCSGGPWVGMGRMGGRSKRERICITCNRFTLLYSRK